jgi:hypothetical protein
MVKSANVSKLMEHILKHPLYSQLNIFPHFRNCYPTQIRVLPYGDKFRISRSFVSYVQFNLASFISFFLFFIILAFPLSPYWSIKYLAVGLFFPLFFPLCAAGLQGTFPGHPRPPSLLLFPFWTTQHEIQHKHPWEAHPAWDLNPADLAVVSEECRSSFHHPTVSPEETYTHIHGPAEVPCLEKILPLR